jgi:predicted MFS family arabinose efflux permease
MFKLDLVVLAAVNRFIWPASAGAVTAAQRGVEQIPLTTKLRAVCVTGMWAFAVYSFYTYLGSALSDVVGLSTGVVPGALIVYGLGAVVGSLSGGRLADRYGAGRIATISLLSLAATLLLVDALIHTPAWQLLASLGVFALTAYPCLPAYQSRLVTTFPTASGSLLAWISFFIYLGTSVSAAVGGVVLTGPGFRWIPILGAVVALIGALIYQRSLPRKAEV